MAGDPAIPHNSEATWIVGAAGRAAAHSSCGETSPPHASPLLLPPPLAAHSEGTSLHIGQISLLKSGLEPDSGPSTREAEPKELCV